MILPIVDYDGMVVEVKIDENQPIPLTIVVPAHPRNQKSESYILQKMDQDMGEGKMVSAYFYVHKDLIEGEDKKKVANLVMRLTPWLFSYGFRHGRKVKNIMGPSSEILTPEKKIIL